MGGSPMIFPENMGGPPMQHTGKLPVLLFDLCGPSVDRVRADPAVGAPSVIADEVSTAIDRFDEVEIVVASATHKHNVIDLEIGDIDRSDRDKRAIVHLALH
jgi:hypothetical protein